VPNSPDERKLLVLHRQRQLQKEPFKGIFAVLLDLLPTLANQLLTYQGHNKGIRDEFIANLLTFESPKQLTIPAQQTGTELYRA